MTGMGWGMTTRVSGIVTTAAEIGVNKTEKNKANNTLQGFIEGVQALQVHPEEVSNKETGQAIVAPGMDRIFGEGVGKDKRK